MIHPHATDFDRKLTFVFYPWNLSWRKHNMSIFLLWTGISFMLYKTSEALWGMRCTAHRLVDVAWLLVNFSEYDRCLRFTGERSQSGQICASHSSLNATISTTVSTARISSDVMPADWGCVRPLQTKALLTATRASSPDAVS